MLPGGLPLFFEYSWVPRFLSFFSPIEIGAITLGPFVFSRTALPMKTRIHEAIHWEQYKETGIILFPVLYLTFWLVNLFRFRFDGKKAYREIPFEKEAYANQNRIDYLFKRKMYAWLR